MLAYANGGLHDYSLIPVFPLRTFRHKSIFVRSDRGIERPADLRGKKVCVSAYSQSKSLMYTQTSDLGWVMIALPWFAQELEDTRKLMGDDFWRYGLTVDNRKTLDALFQYSHEQGFSKRQLNIEELFHPSTLELTEES
jgi:hypothetical protein